MQIASCLLIAVFAIGISIPTAFADSISISTDKSTLNEPYQKFIIQGEVETSEKLREIQIRIYDPDGKLVYSPNVPLNDDGSFHNVAKVESSWIKNGVYRIEAGHEMIQGMAETQIQLQLGAGFVSDTTKLMVSGFEVEYSENTNIMSSFVDPDANTITFTLSGPTQGDVWLKLPDGLISNPNAIWVDGQQIFDFDTSISGGQTQLVIPVGADSTEIVVMGSSVIPEFGSIAAIVLATSIIVTILITSKTRTIGFLR